MGRSERAHKLPDGASVILQFGCVAVNHDRIVLPLRRGETINPYRPGSSDRLQLLHMPALRRFVGLLLSRRRSHYRDGGRDAALSVGR